MTRSRAKSPFDTAANERVATAHERFADQTLGFIATCHAKPLLWRLAVSAAIVFAALAIRVGLLGVLESRLIYVTFFPAVAVAAIAGGLEGGILALVLSAALAHVFLAPASLLVEWVGLATFLVSGAIMIGTAEVLHVARRKIALTDQARQAEQDLHRFVEQAPVAIAMFDREMRYLASSARWSSDYALMGNLIGRSHYDVFPDIPVAWKDIHQRALSGEVIHADEDQFTRQDGSVQWLKWEVRPWYRAEGDISGIIIFSQDITGSKKAQAELSDSNLRLKAIVSTAVDAILVIDEEGIMHSVNPAAERIFGYAAVEMVGKNVRMLMPEGHALAHDGYLETYRKTGERRIIGIGRELDGRRNDGSIFPIDLAVGEWADAREQRFFTGIIRDITKRKQTERQLAQAQTMEAIGQLAGGLAHDINNILAIVSGNLELTENRVKDAASCEAIQRALDAVDMGASLNRRLLTFARQHKTQPVKFDVNDQVRQVTALLGRTLGEHVAVSTELALGLWPTLADPHGVENAIVNLAVNARDAMPEGGKLRIGTRNVTLDAAAVGKMEARGGDFVCVSVSDTGTGMAPEICDRAIEPFFTTKEPGKGTGLGLSSVYGFVKQAGGHLSLESAVGKGTTVHLYLPRAPNQEPKNSDKTPSARDVPVAEGA